MQGKKAAVGNPRYKALGAVLGAAVLAMYILLPQDGGGLTLASSALTEWAGSFSVPSAFSGAVLVGEMSGFNKEENLQDPLLAVIAMESAPLSFVADKTGAPAEHNNDGGTLAVPDIEEDAANGGEQVSKEADSETTQTAEAAVTKAPPPTPAASPAPAKAPPPADSNMIAPITIAPKGTSGYVTAGEDIYIKNNTGLTVDADYLLNRGLPYGISGDGPHVLIVHTHGSEAYAPDGQDYYTPTDVDRTEDTRYNVVRVGDEIAKTLEAAGISVVHDRSIYDSPSYTGSYSRSLEAIKAALKKYPTIKVVIDVHRDAMITTDGTHYKTVSEINGKDAAQVMLVMGTGELGLSHPDWKENLKLALKIQEKMQDKYPGLARPVDLRRERFNQHATTGSMLIEIGTTGNTLEEALYGGRLFAECVADTLNALRE